MRLVAKSRRPEAERASEHALSHLYGCTHTRRALRTKFAKVDFFGCDTIGVRSNGTRVWVQVTAGQTAAVLSRRKKLDAYPWHETDEVYVWQLVDRASIEHPNRKEWYFRVWQRLGDGSWTNGSDSFRVGKAWFKAMKKEGANE